MKKFLVMSMVMIGSVVQAANSAESVHLYSRGNSPKTGTSRGKSPEFSRVIPILGSRVVIEEEPQPYPISLADALELARTGILPKAKATTDDNSPLLNGSINSDCLSPMRRPSPRSNSPLTPLIQTRRDCLIASLDAGVEVQANELIETNRLCQAFGLLTVEEAKSENDNRKLKESDRRAKKIAKKELSKACLEELRNFQFYTTN